MGATGPRPPRFGLLLLRLRRLGDRREEIEADLLEQYQRRFVDRGWFYAAFRYLSDACSLWIGSHPLVVGGGPRPGRRETFVESVWRDLRFAQRLYRRQFGIVTMTVFGLSLAIGVTTAVFSVVNGMFLQPTGAKDPPGLMGVRRAASVELRPGVRVSPLYRYAEYLTLRRHATQVDLMATVGASARLDGADLADPIRVQFVTDNYFQVMGTRPSVGRLSVSAETDGAARGTVVLSYGLWRIAFGADPYIVGRVIRLDNVPLAVAGVAERRFSRDSRTAPAAWLAIELYERSPWNANAAPEGRGSFGVGVTARLRGGVRRKVAEAELSSVAEGALGRPSDPSSGDQAIELYSFVQPDGSEPQVPIALGIAGLVLLLACGNVANMLMTGAASRQREIGLRLALGASRGRVARQLLTESVGLGALGGALGFLFATWLIPVLAGFLGLHPTFDVWPDLRVYGVLVAITIGSGLLAGLAPARHGARGDLVAPLQGEGSRSSGPPQARRFRSWVVAAQCAASAALLILTALLARAAWHAERMDWGFDVDKALLVRVFASAPGQDAGAGASFLRAAAERIQALSGVESTALTWPSPIGGSWQRRGFTSDGQLVSAFVTEASSDYFRTMGIEMLRGRTFTSEEVLSSAPVSVVSARLARGLWGTEDAAGRILRASGGFPPDSRVIGVVGDVVPISLRYFDAPSVYVPIGPKPGLPVLVVRARGDVTAVAPLVAETVRGLDARARVQVELVRTSAERQVAIAQVPGRLSLLAASIALALAVLGVYGVTASAVVQRTREVGVRMALGATRWAVTKHLFRESLRPIGMGLGAGLLLGLASGRLVSALLFGVSPYDPIALGSAACLILGAASAAVIVPVSRASRVDPAVVLRQL